MIRLKTENTTQLRLRDLGFTIAGGMWSDAAWKQIAPGLVVAIAQRHYGSLKEMDTDYSAAPDNETDRCAVFVYRGVAYAGWRISHGESPTEDYAEFLPNMTLAEALRHVAAMENAERLAPAALAA